MGGVFKMELQDFKHHQGGSGANISSKDNKKGAFVVCQCFTFLFISHAWNKIEKQKQFITLTTSCEPRDSLKHVATL